MTPLTRIGTAILEWIFATTWQAAVVVELILLAQWIFRKRLSPAGRYGLWLLLVIRLLMPSSPQTAFSIFNIARLQPQPGRAYQSIQASNPGGISGARPTELAQG